MALTLLVYKAGEVVKQKEQSPEGATTVTIDGLESNTKYGAGEFKVAWTDGKLESDKVDVPEFTTNKIGVQSITSTPDTVTLNAGETQQITNNISPSTADDQTVSYSSNNQPVATVTQDGLIEAVSKGQATITIKSNDNTSAVAKVKVTVNEVAPPEPEPSETETDPVESEPAEESPVSDEPTV